MIVVRQRILHDPENGKQGDCWKCCIASLLEFPYEAVPHFGAMESAPVAETFVNMYLLMFRKCIRRTENKPEGFSMAIGPSPRMRGVDHCVIAKDGEVYFDPHPDKTGLEKIKFYEVIEDF